MTDHPTTQASSDRNRHIRDYLSYYLSLPHPPHYAVMITGPWGIGKTFLIKKLLRELYPDNKLTDESDSWNYIYVSLYGLASRDEIDVALFEAVYPFLGSTVAKAGASIGKGVLKKFGVDLSELKLGKPEAGLYIFDDLERSEMPINKVLGYINEFVEHRECRVIIVANEPNIQDHEYRDRREKLIGKTLEVQLVLDEALDYFIDQIKSSETKSLLQTNRNDLVAVYQQSELHNLRILQQTMWDFDRFFSVLTERIARMMKR
jgi:GTPase SAR1 family protein